MKTVDAFVADDQMVSHRGPLLFAIDAKLIRPMLGGLVDYTPASVPALRHWGIMIFGIGALMVVAAFRPWLRFETMLFSTVEKAFMVYLFLSNLGRPWQRVTFSLSWWTRQSSLTASCISSATMADRSSGRVTSRVTFAD